MGTGVFEKLFQDLFFTPGEEDKFIGVFKEEVLEELERRLTFAGGDSLGAGRRRKRPYIAVKKMGSVFKVVFLTSLLGRDRKEVLIREMCYRDREKPECRQLFDLSFTYRYSYLISEITVRKFSSICGKCRDLEYLEDIPVGGEEKLE
jgi:hypothetical protein